MPHLLEARIKYKDVRRDLSLRTKQAEQYESKDQGDKAAQLRSAVEADKVKLETARENLLRAGAELQIAKQRVFDAMLSYLQSQRDQTVKMLADIDATISSMSQHTVDPQIDTSTRTQLALPHPCPIPPCRMSINL